MGNIGRNRVASVVPSNEKKKQGKDEHDRQKQAEKKRRRLEKALATSAAIRSELEKKKQKKKEEQQRLDEEGAAIAEAVALHVLCDDSDDPCQFMIKKNEKFRFESPWDDANNIGGFSGGWKSASCSSVGKYSTDGFGWVFDAHGSGCCRCTDCGFGWSFAPRIVDHELVSPFVQTRGQGMDLSPGILAAEAVSSLKIAEDAYCATFRGGGSNVFY